MSALLSPDSEQKQKLAVSKRPAPVRIVYTAILCLELIALPLLGFGGWLLHGTSTSSVTRDIELYVGSILVGLAALIQVVVYGLYKKQEWARLFGIALFIVSLLSICLPVAVLGLAMLGSKKAWLAYVHYKSAQGEREDGDEKGTP